MNEKLAAAIQEHVVANKAAIPNDVKQEFCKIWPGVAQGLTAVEAILKAIPGGAIAVPFIAAAISIGNAIQKAVCGA